MEEIVAAFEKATLEDVKSSKRIPILRSFDCAGIAHYVKEKSVSRIVVMSGAGMSVAAGIPDFRTPGTGLYSQLEKYNLPTPESIFTISYFKKNPKPFFTLAKEMWPGLYSPTLAHNFCALLEKKGVLLRLYTQNIDGLERVAGMGGESLVEAHGTFSAAHCVHCRTEYTAEYVREATLSDRIPLCTACSHEHGIVKPDIVFFGESLPGRFSQCAGSDLPQADLLIIIGTSLTVFPFASLADMVRPDIPRVLINRERVGGFGEEGQEGPYRDVFLGGDLQENVMLLAEALGWRGEVADVRAPLSASSSVGDFKTVFRSRGVDFSECLEKADMVRLAKAKGLFDEGLSKI